MRRAGRLGAVEALEAASTTPGTGRHTRGLLPCKARIAGRPAPTFAQGKPGTIVLSVGQLEINQRIAQAAVRRANALQAQMQQVAPTDSERSRG